ncbi:DUF3307 domain-containing protein [Streptococcus ovuberis]|uniref:DUF3307 domain-containing protein n=1 Tax=Streptococcus ovuberis TaxID=1936207 RepID=A0A7X6N1R5_9STRE|nr:DUF3307 domain-containing protein [Streptococcus ovuberis]NKZ20514.1 DUF3307 domain-containing protein [Streptococcus ovuberis]
MSAFSLSHFLVVNPFIALFIICHVLSDFHFQSQKLAELNEKNKFYLLGHLCQVAWPLILLGLYQPVAWPEVIWIICSHAFLDGLEPFVKGYFSERLYFTMDQFIHLAISVSLALSLSEAGAKLAMTLGEWAKLPSIVLFFLLVTKPANLVFRICFAKYQPVKSILNDNQVFQKQEEQQTITGAGATIGTLERLVMGVCILFGQFASIGLVFTAKSIARYNKISENPAFAEYYLIGSLFSILTVMVAAWICL